MGEPDQRADNRQVPSVGGDVAHERPVDLELSDGELLEVGHGRVASAEIIDHQGDAELPQRPELFSHPLPLGRQRALGNL